ncbi:chorismate mutase, partial [Pseudomonas tolaasii]
MSTMSEQQTIPAELLALRASIDN